MEQLLSLVTLLTLATEPETPKSHIELAWSDLSSPLYAEEGMRPDIRYLSLYNIPSTDREDYIKVLNFALNSVSSNRRIQTVDIVRNSHNGLVSFTLSQFGIKRSVYEQFANNPYFNNKKLGKEEFFRRLMQATNSDAPILRADWFIAKAFTSSMYYKLLGASDLEQFKKLICLDDETVKRINGEQAGVVYLSSVARECRVIIRSPTLTGFAWSVISQKAGDDRNLLQSILEPKYDSIQMFGTIPNGLLAYFIADAKGRQLEYMSPDVAVDMHADTRLLRAGVSCIRCHVTGIQDFTDEIRELAHKNKIVMLGNNQKDKNKITDLFGSSLPFKHDQDKYAKVIAKVNGWKVEDNARRFALAIKGYEDSLKDLSFMAKEVGLSLEKFKDFCRLSSRHHLLQLTTKEFRPIHRDQWEALFGDFQE
jgi:hypothetical protein